MSDKSVHVNWSAPAQPNPLIYHPELIEEAADALTPLEADLRELDNAIKDKRPKLTVKRQAIKVLNQYAEIQVRMAFILGNKELWKMLGDKSTSIAEKIWAKQWGGGTK